MEEQQQQIEEMVLAKPQWTALDRKVFGWSLVGTGVTALSLDVVAHGGLTGLLFGLPAAFLLSQSAPHIYKDVKDFLPWTEAQEAISQVVNYREGGSRSLMDRAMGRNYEGQYPSVAGDEVLPDGNLFDFGDDDDTSLPTKSQRKSNIFRFSELLASGFVPTVNKIFVGRRKDNGQDIFVAAKDLCHIAFAGKTGGGKGSLMRLIMTQLCYVGCKVLLLNPHYMRWVVADNGAEFDEDWTPFEGTHPRTNKPYLQQSPIDCADFPPIAQYLEWAVQTLLQERKAAGREGGVRFKPYFIVLDEWPSIVKKIKDAPDYLSDLLREGRKYGIFVILASQDFQVKTIGMDGGSVRKCLLTVFYTGGDKTTGKELLNMQEKDLAENEIGKGVVYLRCVGTQNQPVLVQVPFVDNEAVYKLLGPSTFKKGAQVHVPRQERQQLSDVPTVKDEQNVTLTLEDVLTLINRMPDVDPEDKRYTGDLQPVLRSPSYEQTGSLRVDQVPTRTQPARKSTPTLSPLLQAALDAYRQGNTTCRDLALAVGVGKTKAAELMQQLKARKLID